MICDVYSVQCGMLCFIGCYSLVHSSSHSDDSLLVYKRTQCFQFIRFKALVDGFLSFFDQNSVDRYNCFGDRGPFFAWLSLTGCRLVRRFSMNLRIHAVTLTNLFQLENKVRLMILSDVVFENTNWALRRPLFTSRLSTGDFCFGHLS